MSYFSTVKKTILRTALIIFILNGFSVQAQINRQNSLILDSTDCNFNKPIVLRAGFHFPLGIQPFVSAEVKLLKRITLNTQIGASLDYSPEEALGDLDPWEFAPTGISYFISPELRYYFRPIGRLKKNNQPLFGFSDAYLALKYFASTLSNKKNNSSRFSYENVSAWQLNIGS